jgi:hypothetical protein
VKPALRSASRSSNVHPSPPLGGAGLGDAVAQHDLRRAAAVRCRQRCWHGLDRGGGGHLLLHRNDRSRLDRLLLLRQRTQRTLHQRHQRGVRRRGEQQAQAH